jgi:protein O-GlcNAc transferase
VESFRAAVRCGSDLVAPLINLAGLLVERGEPEEALDLARRATQRDPASVEAARILASALLATGRREESVARYEQLVLHHPGSAELLNDLGFALASIGRADEARASYLRVLELSPGLDHALNNLGILSRAQGRIDEAVEFFRRALATTPRFVEAMHNLGESLSALGRSDEAVAALRQSLAWRPHFAEAWNNLGNALRQQGDDEAGEAAYREALRAKPDHAGALNNLGLLQWHHGEVTAAIGSFRAALRAHADFARAHSNLLFAMHGDPSATPAELLAESRAFDQRHAPSRADLARPHRPDRDPDRRLRVGYLSPDLREHSCAYFLEPLLRAHRREEFELFAYAEVRRPDAVTGRLRSLCDHWRSTVGLTDRELVEQIRADRIDLLVDLAGHSADNRLTALLARPAPVQVTWLGYPGTTGLSTLDYRLTDERCDPTGEADSFHSERLLRLDRGMHCYLAPEAATAVSPSPAARAGHVTFGSFNQLAKMNAHVVAAWARILGAVEGSRLCLKSSALSQRSVRARVLDAFAAHGVAADRLDLLAWTATTRDHLQLYDRVDVALDPFPYNGTTTTCEALWMGVPVITLGGDRHAARVGLSLLSLVGHPELVAASVDDYAARAVDLARDPARLTALRGSLRDEMRTSPLCDAEGFARGVEAAYRRMWSERP